MPKRDHGGKVAIALAGLAVVIAGSGTAVAVSATTTIADPVTPSRMARVDTAGRLTTVGAASTINPVGYVYPYSSDSPVTVTSATRATLALTALSYSNALNTALADNNVSVELVKITVGAAGTCYDTDRSVTLIRRDGVRTGDSLNASFPSPIQFAPVGGRSYCIGANVRYVGTVAASSYPISVSLSAYTVVGNYTGTGTGTAAEPQAAPTAEVGG